MCVCVCVHVCVHVCKKVQTTEVLTQCAVPSNAVTVAVFCSALYPGATVTVSPSTGKFTGTWFLLFELV